MFPCKPDKSPHTPRGFKDASSDRAKVAAYWNAHRGANIGMPTGERSGVFVLDVDRLEALAELEQKYGKLPETLIIRTPSSGRHLYFRHAEGVTNSPGGLPKGIDVRGEGGYVLLPPSTTAKGAYAIEHRAEPAEAPGWLLELIREKPSPAKPSRRRERGRGAAVRWTGGTIEVGTRNRTLLFHALGLKDRGRGLEEILDELLTVNAARCEVPLDEDEVRKIARSASRYPIRAGDPTPEVLEAVGGLEEFWWEHPWPGVGGKTDRDVYRVLLELARRYGRLDEDGSVTVSAAVRSVALAAATTFVTVSGGATKRLARAGLIRKRDDGRGPAEAATWVLLPQARQAFNTRHFGPSAGGMPCVKGSSRQRLWDLGTPAFRWTGHVKKGRAGVLYVLEARGPMPLEALAELLGWGRPRDLRLRYVDQLVCLGLVEERDGLLAIPDGHAERVEEIRRAPYTTLRRIGRESRDGDRVVRWVEERECTASEAERGEKDRQDHEKHREGFRLHLAGRGPEADERCRDLLNRWDEEREAADGRMSELERVESESVGSPPAGDEPVSAVARLTEDEAEDLNAVLVYEMNFEPFGWTRVDWKGLFYKYGRWPDPETSERVKAAYEELANVGGGEAA